MEKPLSILGECPDCACGLIITSPRRGDVMRCMDCGVGLKIVGLIGNVVELDSVYA